MIVVNAATPARPRSLVLGGGTMGAGIAHALLLAGHEVTIVERDDAGSNAARDRVARAVDRSVTRGVLLAADETMSRLALTQDLASVGSVELAIEALPEDLALKVEAFTRLSSVLPASSVLASNTSSISVNTLAAGVDAPERLLGLHFFNPVPSSKLVEIIVGPATAPDVVGYARDLVAALSKTPIVVSDSPGFASSRLGVAVGLEAIRMLEEGVATAGDIDTAMVLGYGFPMGPLRLTDLVGLDVRLGIAGYLERQLGERFTPPQLLKEMVAAGHLGRKSGQGFFEWTVDS